MDDQVINIPLAGDDQAPIASPVDPDVLVVPDKEADDSLPAHATELSDGRVILPLDHPVTLKIKHGNAEVEEKVYDSLTFHRLKGPDMNAILSSGNKSATVAIARSVRIRDLIFDKIYEQMDGSDIMACSQVISYFLDSGKTTGR